VPVLEERVSRPHRWCSSPSWTPRPALTIAATCREIASREQGLVGWCLNFVKEMFGSQPSEGDDSAETPPSFECAPGNGTGFCPAGRRAEEPAGGRHSAHA
jgi:hypothetical protein